jgi:hypothetical protein
MTGRPPHKSAALRDEGIVLDGRVDTIGTELP